MIRNENVQIYWCPFLHILFYYDILYILQAAVCDFCSPPLVLWPTLQFDESVDQMFLVIHSCCFMMFELIILLEELRHAF